MKKNLSLLLTLIWLSAKVFGANPADTTKKTNVPPPRPAPDLPVVITDVYNKYHPESKDPLHRQAGLGDVIVIRVHGFQTLLNKNKEIKLFLDGRQIDDIKPRSGAPEKDDKEFEFELGRTPLNSPVWTTLLGKPSLHDFFKKPIKVSVGVADGYAELSTAKTFEIERISKPWFFFCMTGIVIYIILLGAFRNSPMLRDGGVDLSALNLVKSPTRPFSMARVQMLIWFSVVLVSFMLIWLITNNDDLITGGVLGLIGISSATAIGAVSIDNGKGQETIKAVLDLQQQETALNAEITALQQVNPQDAVTAANLLAKQHQQLQLQTDITQRKASLQLESQGFWNDILTDANGISFHRLQMLIWTLVLVIVFCYSVWASLAMPDFSANLLALQGITAGTYLGFKFPEKQV